MKMQGLRLAGLKLAGLKLGGLKLGLATAGAVFAMTAGESHLKIPGSGMVRDGFFIRFQGGTDAISDHHPAPGARPAHG